MEPPAIDERGIVRVGPDGPAAGRDAAVVEAPLELRDRDGRPLTVTMRTPGHDLDLARGLLFAEGVLRGAGDAAAVVRPSPGALAPEERDNVVA
ncbi:MAG TPA: hypothetical protein VKZ63_11575, partial [Kofleriaceae bacterium]|nr:hypothetical protein [Kofleriaceae bacterium]